MSDAAGSDFGVDANAVAAMFQAATADGTDPAAEVTDSGLEPGTDPTQQPAQVAPQTTEDGPLGPVPDLSDLDPAARAIVEKRIADFQSGFTKRTTELSEAHRFLTDAGMSAEDALAAAQFVQQVQNDPEARAGLYQALKEQFEAEQTPEPTPENPLGDLSDYEDLPPEIRDRLLATDALTARLDAIEAAETARQKEQAEAAYLAEIESNLETQWNGITEAYPDLNDPDVEADVFALGASTGGNLAQAVDIYRRIENRAQAKLHAGASVPGGTGSLPAGAGHSTEPQPIENFEDAGKAALEFLRANSGA